MARHNQPYLPLYVQDLLTDEKLIQCSAESHGVYFRLICILHKQKSYGEILLKQKFKQSSSTCLNFATQLALFLPFPLPQIERALKELLEEDVIQIEGDILSQKRMVRDAEISLKRSESGKKGGESTARLKGSFAKAKSKGNAKKFAKAKVQANTENEYDNEIENEYDNEKGGLQRGEIIEVIEYLNLATESSYKASTDKTVKAIEARMNEGFTTEQIKRVIDYKTWEWKATEFEKFLRPETLFGNKFEGYYQASLKPIPKIRNNGKQDHLKATITPEHARILKDSL